MQAGRPQIGRRSSLHCDRGAGRAARVQPAERPAFPLKPFLRVLRVSIFPLSPSHRRGMAMVGLAAARLRPTLPTAGRPALFASLGSRGRPRCARPAYGATCVSLEALPSCASCFNLSAFAHCRGMAMVGLAAARLRPTLPTAGRPALFDATSQPPCRPRCARPAYGAACVSLEALPSCASCFNLSAFAFALPRHGDGGLAAARLRPTLPTAGRPALFASLGSRGRPRCARPAYGAACVSVEALPSCSSCFNLSAFAFALPRHGDGGARRCAAATHPTDRRSVGALLRDAATTCRPRCARPGCNPGHLKAPAAAGRWRDRLYWAYRSARSAARVLLPPRPGNAPHPWARRTLRRGRA